MDKANIKLRLHQGKKDEIIQDFEQLNYFVNLDAIAQIIQTHEFTAYRVFEIFVFVADFTTPPNQDVTKESMQRLRDGLKPLLPPGVVDAPDSFSKAIPDYLRSKNIEADTLFRRCWQALHEAGRDDKTIGIGWGAYLYL